MPLTPAGELVLARARSALAQVDGVRADLAELATVTRGPLRIGATQLLASIDLPRLLAGFHRRYPGVTIALRTGLIADLLADLDAGRIDVALCPVHDDLPAAYLGQPLAAESVVLATPPGRHTFAGGVARLADVRDEPFVCLPAGSGLRGILADAAAAAGFEPRIPFETHSPASICELVAAGLGVALLAGSSARAAGPAIDVLPAPARAGPPAHRPGPAARPPPGPGRPGLGRAPRTGLRTGAVRRSGARSGRHRMTADPVELNWSSAASRARTSQAVSGWTLGWCRDVA